MSGQDSLIHLQLHPKLLQGGFWLYVWRVQPLAAQQGGDCPVLLYVGRTGDSSSPKAAPPYRRIGQHLGFQPASNALRRHLHRRGVGPETCHQIDFYSYGPLYPEQVDMTAHTGPRDMVAALECKLAAALAAGGYEVMNKVRSCKPLDVSLWIKVREVFKKAFSGIAD